MGQGSGGARAPEGEGDLESERTGGRPSLREEEGERQMLGQEDRKSRENGSLNEAPGRATDRAEGTERLGTITRDQQTGI